jgi:hypothetical protein
LDHYILAGKVRVRSLFLQILPGTRVLGLSSKLTPILPSVSSESLRTIFLRISLDREMVLGFGSSSQVELLSVWTTPISSCIPPLQVFWLLSNLGALSSSSCGWFHRLSISSKTLSFL